jgi:hypothetical protein
MPVWSATAMSTAAFQAVTPPVCMASYHSWPASVASNAGSPVPIQRQLAAVVLDFGFTGFDEVLDEIFGGLGFFGGPGGGRRKQEQRKNR